MTAIDIPTADTLGLGLLGIALLLMSLALIRIRKEPEDQESLPTE